MANQIMDSTFYSQITEILSNARAKVYNATNFAMVEAYWEIGKSIVEKQGGNATAEYGIGLLKELSKQMTADFGKGFTVANLKNMRQFYLTFQNRYALRSQLSWTHYRMIMRVEDPKAREFYIDECAKANWSTRQLERQIGVTIVITNFFKDVFLPLNSLSLFAVHIVRLHSLAFLKNKNTFFKNA